MKKLFFTLMVLVSFTLVSCDTKETGKPLTKTIAGYFIPDDEIVESQEVKYFHVTQKGDVLWKLSALTLGDSARYGEILVQTPEVGNNLHKRFFIFKADKPGVKIYPGDTLWIPMRDQFTPPANCQTAAGKRSIELVTSKSLEDYRDTKTITTSGGVLPTPISIGDESSTGGIPQWLNDFFWIVFAIIVLALVLWFLRWLYDQLRTVDNNPPVVTPPAPQNLHVQVDVECCGGCNNGRPCEQNTHSNGCDTFSNKLIAGSVFNKGLGEATGPRGYASSTLKSGEDIIHTVIDNRGCPTEDEICNFFELIVRQRFPNEKPEDIEKYQETFKKIKFESKTEMVHTIKATLEKI